MRKRKEKFFACLGIWGVGKHENEYSIGHDQIRTQNTRFLKNYWHSHDKDIEKNI